MIGRMIGSRGMIGRGRMIGRKRMIGRRRVIHVGRRVIGRGRIVNFIPLNVSNNEVFSFVSFQAFLLIIFHTRFCSQTTNVDVDVYCRHGLF